MYVATVDMDEVADSSKEIRLRYVACASVFYFVNTAWTGKLNCME